MKLEISAIICTHNRSKYLNNAIKSLCNQTLSKDRYEVIVVDNASADQTKNIVKNFQRSYPNIKYVYEVKLGLSTARNTGLNSARGEFVAFLDDDAIASPEWLSQILKAFDTVFPTPVCVGGKVLPIWEMEKPDWFPEQFVSSLSVLDKGDEPRFLADNEIIIGTNMSYDKNILQEIGGFNEQLELYGDEVYIQEIIKKNGLWRFYQPAAIVKHFIPKSRLTKNYICKRKYLSAKASFILLYNSKHTFTSKLFCIITHIIFKPMRIFYHLFRVGCSIIKSNVTNEVLHRVQVYKNFGFWVQAWHQIFK